MDADTINLTANGFANCLTRDGQGSATANQPMNGFRHTNVGNAQVATDYLSLGQYQLGEAINWSTDSGAADAIAVTYTPAIASLTDGQLCFVRAANANTTTTPTFAPNGLTAHTITKVGGAALVAGDIKANQELILRYNLSNTRWELCNPQFSAFNPQTSNTNWIVAGGTANAITATYAPAITALLDGMLCWFRASAANSTTTPTFAPNGLTAHTITKEGGTALVNGDIPAALAEVILRYNLANTRWELLNPVNPPVAVTLPTRQVLLSGSAATYTTPASCRQIIVKFIGGGGGGGGPNGGGTGGVGGTTTFNSVNAIGGSGGVVGGAGGANVPGGIGGTGGTGSATMRIAGSHGGGGGSMAPNTTPPFATPGGLGGNGPFGGAGANTAAAANSGAGGGGADKAVSGGSSGGSGGGGGSGEYVELIIPSPAGTYTYTVGAAGSAGTGGGFAGGTGIIIVDETY